MPAPLQPPRNEGKGLQRGGFGFVFFFLNFTRYHFEFRKHQFPFSCKGKCPNLCNLILFLVCFLISLSEAHDSGKSQHPSLPPLLHFRNYFLTHGY